MIDLILFIMLFTYLKNVENEGMRDETILQRNAQKTYEGAC